MYNTSAEFNAAVFENSPEENILFRFNDGTIFTNEDIHLDSGVSVVEGVNFNDELTIGTCNSANLATTIMNYHRLLSGYEFGECAVSLGVKLRTDSHDAVDANAWVVLGYGTEDAVTITCHSAPPYIKLNNIATAAQPNFPVMALYSDTGGIHCIGEEGQTWSAMLDAFAPGELDPIDFTFNAFMTNKLKLWAQDNRGVVIAGDMMYEFFVSGEVDVHEFAPLGVFLINTPLKRKTDLIQVDAFDGMAAFDVSADTFIESLFAIVKAEPSRVLTLNEMCMLLCDYVGATFSPHPLYKFMGYKFRNGDAEYFGGRGEVWSRIWDAASARDILGWIAEMACSNARMNRQGLVEFTWFNDPEDVLPPSLTEEQIFTIDTAEHQVQPIDQLRLSNNVQGEDKYQIYPDDYDGVNVYTIINNPFLKWDAYGNNSYTPQLEIIADELLAFSAFSPMAVTALCNWAIQAGDVLFVDYNNNPQMLPIYCQTIVWRGGAVVTYENSGKPERPASSVEKEGKYVQDRELYGTFLRQNNGSLPPETDMNDAIAPGVYALSYSTTYYNLPANSTIAGSSSGVLSVTQSSGGVLQQDVWNTHGTEQYSRFSHTEEVGWTSWRRVFGTYDTLSDGTNLNDMVQPGIYGVMYGTGYSYTGLPTGLGITVGVSSSGTLVVTRNDIGTYGQMRQHIFRWDGGEEIVRYSNSTGEWQPWKRIDGAWTNRDFQILTGYTVVTPDSANVSKSVSITFSTAFSGVPMVVCTPNTNAPATVNVGASSISETGFTLSVQRPNTSAVGIHWIAIYRG